MRLRPGQIRLGSSCSSGLHHPYQDGSAFLIRKGWECLEPDQILPRVDLRLQIAVRLVVGRMIDVTAPARPAMGSERGTRVCVATL